MGLTSCSSGSMNGISAPVAVEQRETGFAKVERLWRVSIGIGCDARWCDVPACAGWATRSGQPSSRVVSGQSRTRAGWRRRWKERRWVGGRGGSVEGA